MATENTSVVLGKRKEPSETSERDVSFEIRVILENLTATEPILIPATSCSSMANTFSAVKEQVPLTRRHSVLGEPLCAPVFFLQETSEKTWPMRHIRWTEVNWGNPRAYARWYDRNVKEGKEPQLKIEIHLRTGNCAMEEFERQLEDAAAGKAILNDRRFRVFVPEKLKGPASHEWVVHPKDLGDVDEEDLKAIVRAPSTDEWFPARKAVNAEEEGQHRAKRMRANEEEETLGAEKAQEEKAPEAEAEGEEEVVGAEEGDHWSDLTIDLDLPDDGLPLLFWDEE